MEVILKRLRLDKRGVSNVIVAMLSLVLIVIVVANVILWSYQMNQLDWERMQEKVAISNVEQVIDGVKLSLKNEGSVTCHVVAIWTISSTRHERYKIDFFLNSGASADCVKADMVLPSDTSIVKIVTERGNIAVFRKD